ncbi:hypothetical protein B0T16DRAFT_369522 [Cercophora newfieldiana]|uniref:Uncharacterized protein n=1 Tax=Cercophora newfieldiana TaxID=92897 RepID=A0AA39YHM8_9PEZI|nr:hypothetical protein B0T16DRAFT_369522 [Cercophora newfieldiana]
MDRIFGNESTSRPATWKPEPSERGTFGILSTCIITLGLCVWTAIHLNVPARNGQMQQFLRKVGWMVFGFLAPELVAFTAIQQYATATKLSKEIAGIFPPERHERAWWQFWRGKRRRRDAETQGSHGTRTNKTCPWTFVHSQFAMMGGFVFMFESHQKRHNLPRWLPRVREDQPIRMTLTADGLAMLAKKAPHVIPDLSKDAIKDKSKGSAFAKTLVCLQALWFCVQCLTRFGQHLGISLLELNTFAHAICTLVTYSLWWHKPLDVQEPEPIPITDDFDADLIIAMTVFGKFGNRPREAVHLHRDGGTWKFTFKVEDGGSLQSSWIVGYGEEPETDSGHRRSSWPWKRQLGRRQNLRLDVRSISGSEHAHGSWGYINLGETVCCLEFLADVSAEEGLQNEDGNDKSTDHRRLDDDLQGPVTESYARIWLGSYHHDAYRWGTALDRLPLPDVQHATLLTDYVGNLPRFEGVGRQWLMYFGFAVTGFIYGGLHCLAWNVPFPTKTELMLWKLSSVAVSSTGALLLLVYTWELIPPFWGKRGPDFVATLYEKVDKMVAKAPVGSTRAAVKKARFRAIVRSLVFLLPSLCGILKVLYDISIVLFMVFYCAARLYLVVESFINLIHLPDSVYAVPKWSQYMPHIG